MLSGFWSVMNESFDRAAAKGSFGRISGLGTLGGLAGGLMAERVAAWVSPSAGVLLLAILHLACAVLLWRAFPPAPAVKSPRAPASRRFWKRFSVTHSSSS